MTLSDRITKIASGSDDQTVKLWDLDSGSLLFTYRGHSDWVRDICFSPDGEYIASASDDNTVKLWSTETGQLVRTMRGHNDYVSKFSIGFSFSR